MTKNENKLCDILRGSENLEDALHLAIKLFSAFAEPPQEAQEPLLADLRESC
jgi:hypothetical protein